MEINNLLKFKILFLIFISCNFLTYANENEDFILGKSYSIIENDSISLKDKKKQLITYLNATNLGITNSKIGFYYGKISRKFHSKKNYKLAIVFSKKAVKIYKKEKNFVALKKRLYDLGVFYLQSEKLNESIKTFREILNIGKEDYDHARVYQRLGVIFDTLGDFEKALEYKEKAIDIFKTINTNDKLIIEYNSKAFIYFKMDPIQFKSQIIESLNESERLISLLKEEEKALSYQNTVYLVKGKLLVRTKKLNQAISFFDKGLEGAIKLNDKKRILEFENNLGVTFLKLKKNEEAFYYLTKSLQMVKNYQDKAEIHNNLADYYYQQKDFTKAEAMYLASVNIFTKSHQKPTVKELQLLPNKPTVRDLLEQTADFYFKQYKLTGNKATLKKSLEYIQLTDAVIDMIRLENTEQKSKLYWRTKGKELYIKGVKIAHLLGNTSDAFYFMEKSKVLLLLEEISEEQAKELSGIPEDLKIKEFLFKNKISRLASRLLEVEKAKKDSLKDQLFALKRKYTQFRDSVQTAFPTYAQLKKDIKIVKNTAISKEMLKEHTAIISYILTDNEGYGFVKTKETSKVFKIENVQKLHRLLADLKNKITKRFFTEEEFTSFNTVSQATYQHLFSNIEHQIKDKTQFIIIPDESMATVPFEVLQKDIPKEPLQPNYIFHDTNISYAFSVSHLHALKALKNNAEKGFLGIAPIDFKEKSLASLINSKQEIQNINDIFSGTLLMNEKATKQKSIENMQNHAIIHIASHANYDEHNNTWLWLYDDTLTFTELHGLKNNADLVVLNACKTLQGEQIQGEGVMSLTRGFFASGAKSVVASLWNSNDGSTQKITTQFYQHLKNKLPKDEALSLAKKEYLQSHYGSETSPYYWASMTVTGNLAAIDQSVYSSNNDFLFISIAVLIVLVLLYRFLKHKP